jgi:hypothetical protein
MSSTAVSRSRPRSDRWTSRRRPSTVLTPRWTYPAASMVSSSFAAALLARTHERRQVLRRGRLAPGGEQHEAEGWTHVVPPLVSQALVQVVHEHAVGHRQQAGDRDRWARVGAHCAHGGVNGSPSPTRPDLPPQAAQQAEVSAPVVGQRERHTSGNHDRVAGPGGARHAVELHPCGAREDDEHLLAGHYVWCRRVVRLDVHSPHTEVSVLPLLGVAREVKRAPPTSCVPRWATG